MWRTRTTAAHSGFVDVSVAVLSLLTPPSILPPPSLSNTAYSLCFFIFLSPIIQSRRKRKLYHFQETVNDN